MHFHVEASEDSLRLHTQSYSAASIQHDASVNADRP